MSMSKHIRNKEKNQKMEKYLFNHRMWIYTQIMEDLWEIIGYQISVPQVWMQYSTMQWQTNTGLKTEEKGKIGNILESKSLKRFSALKEVE